MNNTQLRDSLITQADGAFLALAGQVNYLLDSVQWYDDTHPVKTKSDRMKSVYLSLAVKDMSQLLKQIAHEIDRWKKEEAPVLSKLGVELQYLNELKATIEATMLFLIREDMALDNFVLAVVNQSHVELIRCNRLL